MPAAAYDRIGGISFIVAPIMPASSPEADQDVERAKAMRRFDISPLADIAETTRLSADDEAQRGAARVVRGQRASTK